MANEWRNVYFVGIGGIGMSALARYFNTRGVKVSGYDRTPTALTALLQAEGIEVRFTEDVDSLPEGIDLVVRTPAIADSHLELVYFREQGFPILKRAQVLGALTQGRPTLAVAGTHGKTTVSSMIAHLLHASPVGCTAFLGGIATNYQTNFIGGESENAVVEADEYDRSFLHLHPDIAVITAVDPDHMEIYGDLAAIEDAFLEFSSQIKPGGALVLRHGLPIEARVSPDRLYTYGTNEAGADFQARNLQFGGRVCGFDLISPVENISGLRLKVPGYHNVENATAAIAVAQLMGAGADDIRKALSSYEGVARRFEYVIDTPELVFIDDYAHHPKEVEAVLTSVRDLYPDRRITAVFQPHLFTRTRDFADEFAASLSLADEVMLLDIYPAREEPIEGVTSTMLIERMRDCKRDLVSKDELTRRLLDRRPQVLLTIGAGDIGALIGPLARRLGQ
ncbi:MAG: UDP-N-acetylmuramate--L-alanine ligase [Bradymonadaceae bacterium]